MLGTSWGKPQQFSVRVCVWYIGKLMVRCSWINCLTLYVIFFIFFRFLEMGGPEKDVVLKSKVNSVTEENCVTLIKVFVFGSCWKTGLEWCQKRLGNQILLKTQNRYKKHTGISCKKWAVMRKWLNNCIQPTYFERQGHMYTVIHVYKCNVTCHTAAFLLQALVYDILPPALP